MLFDFPRDPSEYVRRVGRTARGAGGKGVVSILVLGRQVGWRLELPPGPCFAPACWLRACGCNVCKGEGGAATTERPWGSGVADLHPHRKKTAHRPRPPTHCLRAARPPPARSWCCVQVKLAQDIINRNQKGLPVHRVPDAPIAGDVLGGEEEEEEGAGLGRGQRAAEQQQQQQGQQGWAQEDEME